MGYFLDRQPDVRLPVGVQGDGGLRRGQRGAVHALAAHFTLERREPGLVVMPTGSGKTGVMMIAPFLVGACRVLVVTPSRLVRTQIADEFRTMGLLNRLGVLPDVLTAPSVKEVEHRLTTVDAWEELRPVEVVVTTPSAASPAYKAIADPPADLFDLVLVDEAHHAPARTWNGLLESFPSARRVLFTATPFRRDEGEIKGEFVFVYPVEEAVKDDIFRPIRYIPVKSTASRSSDDVAISLAAERAFQADAAAGYLHSLLIRTDEKDRADELAKVYAENTSLRLRPIHSGLSYSTIKQTIKKLRTRDLDGIICVDMLGEGFDFPHLKIAAVHAPHKSLAVTMQFIGRFARTGPDRIGDAKFLAIQSDIKVQSVELYEEGAIWENLVPSLLTEGVDNEVRMRRVLDTFEPWGHGGSDDGVQDISLYTLYPYHHVVAYEVFGDVDLDANVDLGTSVSIEHRWTSEAWSATVFITKEQVKPRWVSLNVFPGVKHDLFIAYHSKDRRFLFICASDRGNDALYQTIVEQLCPKGARRVSQDTAQKALLELTDHEFFMVGMRNQMLNSNSESYRMIAGPTANKGVRPTDGRSYLQGHSYGRARDGGEDVTIGWSGLGKVWSNKTARVPEFLEWCEKVARRLASNQTVRTQSELDHLPMGARITTIPLHPISANWDDEAFTKPWSVAYQRDDGSQHEGQLLDLEWRIDHDRCNEQEIRLELVGPGLHLPVAFRIERGPQFGCPNGDTRRITLERGRRSISLLQYLNARPLSFFFWDFSYLVGDLYAPSQAADLAAFDPGRIEAPDWTAAGVDIEREYGPSTPGKRSVHDFLREQLLTGGAGIVFYDHDPQEIADFVTITEEDRLVRLEFFHCKASSKPFAGARVADLYDVCGQVEKSLRWVNDNQRLFAQLAHRSSDRPDRFIRGGANEASHLLEVAKRKQTTYRIAIVQPGLLRDRVTQELQTMLAAADDYIARWGCENLRVIGSAGSPVLQDWRRSG